MHRNVGMLTVGFRIELAESAFHKHIVLLCFENKYLLIYFIFSDTQIFIYSIPRGPLYISFVPFYLSELTYYLMRSIKMQVGL